MHRRNFLKNAAAFSVCSSLLSRLSIAKSFQMSEMESFYANTLTTFSVLEDVFLLSIQSGLLPFEAIGYLYCDYNLAGYSNFSRFGWMANADEATIANVLLTEHERAQQINRDMTKVERDNPESAAMIDLGKARSKVSMMLGWYMAAGIREIMEPVWNAAGNDLYEMRMYQDMCLLKERAGKDIVSSFSEIESLFNQMIPRMVTRTHTLTPDYDDGQNWTVRISEWHKELPALINQYATTYVNPDTNKLKKYIVDSDFYNAEEAIIQAARSRDRLDYQIMAQAESLYGKAVFKGIESLIEGSQALIPASVGEKMNLKAIPFKLKGNYPNPFNPQTHIEFILNQPGMISLDVFDSLGRSIKSLRKVKYNTGVHHIQFNGSDLPSGNYIYKLTMITTNQKVYSQTGRMTLVK